MATLIPANSSVDWPVHYLTSNLALENSQQAEVLVQQVRARTPTLLLACLYLTQQGRLHRACVCAHPSAGQDSCKSQTVPNGAWDPANGGFNVVGLRKGSSTGTHNTRNR